MSRPITYHLTKKMSGSLARVGEVHTPHGIVKTPAFVAVGTKATVKGVDPAMYKALGLQCIITNGYHLYLNPGEKIVEQGGGVSKFMGWHGPTMTDSGGFQVFSLGVAFGKEISKIAPEDISHDPGVAVYNEELATEHGKLAIVDDDGVTFTSHVNGTLHRFTPERSIEIQHGLGADIMFAFDEFIVPTAPESEQRESMERTHAWAKRSLAAHRQNFEASKKQGLFGIVQGGRFNNLREESARFMADMDFDGYGIGGTLTKADLLGMLDIVNNILPEDKPRHLLGIGEPEDMFIGIAGGIDTFDCVLPTKNGRNGTLFTFKGKMNINRSEFQTDQRPLDEHCDCMVCKAHTRSYVHHLFRSNEMLGPMLATMHNVYFLTHLVDDIRQSILDDRFEAFRDAFMKRYTSGE